MNSSSRATNPLSEAKNNFWNSHMRAFMNMINSDYHTQERKEENKAKKFVKDDTKI